MPRFKRNERGEMPFLDHLEELRWRLIWSLLALTIGFVAGFVLVDQLDVMGLLMRPIAPHLAGGKLFFTSPIEPFMITLKLAFFVGVVLASPVIVWQLWRFLSPALYEKERRVVLPVSLAAVALFLAGVAMAYFLILPTAIRVLFGFQSHSLQPIVTAKEYFGFAAQVVIAFGAIFELPLVLLALVYLRVISAGFLGRNRRFAIAGNAFLSMLLAPPDLISMTLMMVPVQLLYEITVVIARVMERRRTRSEAAAEAVAATSEA
ncbi:MAG TPA: twin-arginine translocase subunit TatC [Gemmatimonadales bacterium]|nr:twin-arginine translocase subunit TatC [Gemmatimonadales bacterium]